MTLLLELGCLFNPVIIGHAVLLDSFYDLFYRST